VVSSFSGVAHWTSAQSALHEERTGCVVPEQTLNLQKMSDDIEEVSNPFQLLSAVAVTTALVIDEVKKGGDSGSKTDNRTNNNEPFDFLNFLVQAFTVGAGALERYLSKITGEVILQALLLNLDPSLRKPLEAEAQAIDWDQVSY
jgi:hypothetical protein